VKASKTDRNASAANLSFLLNTATIFTPLISCYLLSEPTGRVCVVAAATTMSGVVLMSYDWIRRVQL
jgi:drug/metabolite transporter (DMT)-like permease